MVTKHEMFVQILLTRTIRNEWRMLRRICILILGLKGLKTFKQSEKLGAGAGA